MVFMEDWRCDNEDWKFCGWCSSEVCRLKGSLNSFVGLGRIAIVSQTSDRINKILANSNLTVEFA
jgi:hypothetical protein